MVMLREGALTLVETDYDAATSSSVTRYCVMALLPSSTGYDQDNVNPLLVICDEERPIGAVGTVTHCVVLEEAFRCVVLPPGQALQFD